MKNTLLSALAVALLMASAPRARSDETANELKPFAVVSFAGYAELKRDLEYLGTASENPNLAKGLEALLMMLTQEQGLAGLDEDRPWGVATGFDQSGTPTGWAFLPVTDLQKLFGAFAGRIGEPQDAGNDVWEFQHNGNSIYAKQQGGWAFISHAADHLAGLPAEPAELLGELPKQYDLAVRIHVQNIPPAIRELGIDQFKNQAAQMLQGMNLQAQPGADEAAQAVLIRQQVEEIAKTLNEIDQFTLGFSIDAERKRSFLDVALTAVEGSDAAGRLKTETAGQSKFAGFLLPSSLFSLHVNEVTGEEDLPTLLALFDNFRTDVLEELDKDEDFDDEAQRDTVKQFVGELLAVVQATLAKGRLNLGLTVLGSGPLNVALGGYVADGERLEAAVKKLADLSGDEPGSPTIKFDVLEHDGVRFHAITVPLADLPNDSPVKQLLGDPIQVTIGFGPESVYVAAGPDGVATIRKVIDESSTATAELPPLHLTLALGQILNLAARQGAAHPLVGLGAMMLQGGADHVHVMVQPLDNGVRYRLEIEEGLVKLIGTAAGMLPGGGNL